MSWQALFGERATTKVAAIYPDEAQANAMADRLRTQGDLNATQVWVVAPGDDAFARKLEPEPAGVFRTGVRSHLVFGVAGLLVGLLIWAVLRAMEVRMIVTTPVLSLVAFLFVAGSAGGLLAGLLTIRPDHQLVIQRVRTACTSGEWSLVVHPRSPKECDRVVEVLTASGAQVVRSV